MDYKRIAPGARKTTLGHHFPPSTLAELNNVGTDIQFRWEEAERTKYTLSMCCVDSKLGKHTTATGRQSMKMCFPNQEFICFT